jgi:transcription termination factor Rho
MELHLSRELQERRVFPAFDIRQSSTRREELLLGPDITQRVWLLRRMIDMRSISDDDELQATEDLINNMRRTMSNDEFMQELTPHGAMS